MKDLSFRALPAVASLPTPSATYLGVMARLTTDNKPYFCNGSAWVDLTLTGSGGGSSSSLTRNVAKTAHGWSVGQCVYFENGTGVWISAQAGGLATRVTGIVSSVVDANNVVVTIGGIVSGFSGLTPGNVFRCNPETGLLEDLVSVSANTYDYTAHTIVAQAISATEVILISSYWQDDTNYTGALRTMFPHATAFTTQVLYYYDLVADTYLPAIATSMASLAGCIAISDVPNTGAGLARFAVLSNLYNEPSSHGSQSVGILPAIPVTAADGTKVYLSDTVAGGVTTTPPAGIRQVVGYVISNLMVPCRPFLEPSGATGSVQFNNNGVQAGASNVGIDSGDLVLSANASPTIPATGKVKLFGKQFGGTGGRVIPAAMGPSGMDYSLQPHMGRQNVALWKPPGNATTVPGVFGMAAATAVGTATARTIATTNALTRARRLGYVSSTTAGTLCGAYWTAAQHTVGNGSGLGGFFGSIRFGVSDATLQSAARSFVGFTSSVAAPTNVDPATLTNCFGIGHTAADTNWYIYYGGSAAQPRINLGSSFPIANTDLIDITFWSPPSQAGVVFYHATRVASNGATTEASGQLVPGPTGSALPANTTLLAPRAWRSNNTAAAAVGIDINSVYIETDW